MKDRLKERRTLLSWGIPIMLGALVAFLAYPQLLALFVDTLPLRHRHLYGLAQPVPFETRLKIASMCAFGLALPEIVWQSWQTTAPALTRAQHELRERLLPLAALAPVAGVAVGYLVVIPWLVRFSSAFDDHQFLYLPQAATVVTGNLRLLLFIAVLFELPVFLAGLGRAPRGWAGS